MSEARPLGQDQREAFERDGYLVLEGFASAEEVDALRARALQLVEGFDLRQVVSIFSRWFKRPVEAGEIWTRSDQFFCRRSQSRSTT